MSLTGATRATWYLPVLALSLAFLLWRSNAMPSILLLAMLVTWTVFPMTAWLGSFPFSTGSPIASRLLWLTRGYEPDRLRPPLLSHVVAAGQPVPAQRGAASISLP